MIPWNTWVEFKLNPEDEKSKTLIGKVIGNNDAGDVFIEWTSSECRRTPAGKVTIPKELFSRKETEVTPIIK